MEKPSSLSIAVLTRGGVSLITALLVLAGTGARAQLVADGATASVSGTSTNLAGNLIVGNTSSFTTLGVINGGTVTNTGTGTIGSTSTSRSNLVLVAGANSVWNNGSTLAIGGSGSYNQLLISNGGKVIDTFGNIGLNTTAVGCTVAVSDANSLWYSSQRVNVGSGAPFCRLFVTNGGTVVTLFGSVANASSSVSNLAVVAGTGSLWTNSGSMSVGTTSHYNQMWVTNGGTVRAPGSYIGTALTQSGSGSSNSVTVAGAGSSWINTDELSIGDFGSGNRLTVSQGATWLNSTPTGILKMGTQPVSSNNVVLVTGTNSLYSSLGTTARVSVGYNGSGNQLLVRDGARFESDFSVIGDGGSNNLAVVADPGSKWLSSSAIYVGFSGISGRLLVTNGGVVETRNASRLGNIASSSNNLVLISGAGSLWTNVASLYVGSDGSGNELDVAASGMLTTPQLVVGFSSLSSNNVVNVSDGTLVATNASGTGMVDVRGGSLLLNGGAVLTDVLLVTNNSPGAPLSSLSFNHGRLTTRRGSTITGNTNLLIGNTLNQTADWMVTGGTNTVSLAPFSAVRLGALGGRCGVLTVTGTGTLWTSTNTLHVGYGSSSNQLFVTNGGRVSDGDGYLATSTGTTDNQAWITDPGSVWSSSSQLFVGSSGAGSQLVVSNGAWVVDDSAFVGLSNTASNTFALVTGAGSVWSNHSAFYLGWDGSSNSVVVANGGLLVAPDLTISPLAGSNNLLTVSGGYLAVTNSSTNATLRIGQGGRAKLNLSGGGLVEADSLVMTNANGSGVSFASGTLRTRATSCANGFPFSVGDGSPALLDLRGNGTHQFGSGLTVYPQAVMQGNGLISGNTVLFGTLSPGSSIGQLRMSGTLSCQAGSTNLFEIDKAAGTNDSVVSLASVTYGGTLVVTNLGGTLALNDSFKLFDAATYAGSFSALRLPPLDPGLAWQNRLAIDGTIRVGTNLGRDFGVDVSHFQAGFGVPQSSWAQMYSEGKRFAFIKGTEGLTGPDDAAMSNNMVRATAAGLLAGVYHYAHPENRPTPSGAVQEADHLLTYAGSFVGPGYLRPVLDLEFSAGGLSTSDLTDWVIAFRDRIVAARGSGAAPIIYCSQSFANVELDSRLAGYDLWLRTVGSGADPASDDPPGQGFGDATGVFTNWSFWQYSDAGSSGGISPLDLNICHSEVKPLSSFIIPPLGSPVAPIITAQPASQTVPVGGSATFTVSLAVTSTPPFSFQWRFKGTNLAAATQLSYAVVNAQATNAGGYSVVVSNAAGSVTSAVATLAVLSQIALYQENFDNYAVPSVINNAGTVNGFNIFYGADSGPQDFSASFGFDYSTVSVPTLIPPAPNSTGGTTRGLRLTVNKDATGAPAAINLYPVGQSFSGTFALRFDLWINWTTASTATEHTLFGINHSGTITNRVGQVTSDGLFFAMNGDGGSTSTSPTLRDYSVFQGTGAGLVPKLITNSASFGPAPLLGAQFDNGNAGFSALFPSQSLPGVTTAAGAAGMRWIRAEVRQETNLVTWLLNDTIVAQYTNTTPYASGNIMLGYNDNFPSIGDANDFVILDNIRVEVANPDSDANGLGDVWETQYFGELGSDPGADPDGDGASNLAEYLAGTNPTNSASAFRFLGAAPTNNSLLLSWSTVAGHGYVVQIQTNATGGLGSGFVDLSPVIIAGGSGDGTTNYLQIGGATNPGAYYRVRLAP